MIIESLVQELQARIPELEWKLAEQSGSLSPRLFPRGLFRNTLSLKPQAYIQEIKDDLLHLSTQSNLNAGRYLAQKIHEKITMLVRWCYLQEQSRQRAKAPREWGLAMIATRQQWMQKLEESIQILTVQVQAIEIRLQKLKSTQDKLLLLAVQKEYGEAKKKLTLAEEHFKQQTMEAMGLDD